MFPTWSLPLLFICSAALTYLVRNAALSRGVIDNPNARSSHQQPTPHGGGIGFVLPFIGFSFILWGAEKTVSTDLFVAVAGSGAIIAGLGFWDDLHNLSPRRRIVIQLLTVIALLGWSGDIWLYSVFPWQWIGWVFAAVAILWWVNLYNFMDGIDGLAACEGMCICLGCWLLLGLSGGQVTVISGLAGALFAVLGGFLVWNWAPAKIFMGDVGSCFIGIVIAVLALFTIQAQAISVWGWMIITALFWTDATLTLLRRISLGQTWHQAHRSHAYQILSRQLQSHSKVTLLGIGVNIFWLIPMALLEVLYPAVGAWITLLACAPLLVFQWYLGAGVPE